MHRLRLRACTFAAVTIAALIAAPAARADSFTLFAFADPAADASTPAFRSDGAILSGNWLGTGLLLETPGVPAPDYPDATYRMTNLTIGANGVTSGGSIIFKDSAGITLFTIEFASGQLDEPLGFGASDFTGHDVTISGPIIPFALSEEAFAFSFANPAVDGNFTTYTAAFTSSAVPEPGTLAVVALGALAVRLRKRSR